MPFGGPPVPPCRAPLLPRTLVDIRFATNICDSLNYQVSAHEPAFDSNTHQIVLPRLPSQYLETVTRPARHMWTTCRLPIHHHFRF